MAKNINETQEQCTLHSVTSSFSFCELLEIIHQKDKCAKYSIQYSDYEDNQWTKEILLTYYRIEKLKNDNSVRKVLVKFSNGSSLVVTP